VRRDLAVLLVIGACGAAACIIGPKQDDPLNDKVPVDDVGASTSDTSLDVGAADSGATADTESPPFTMDGDGGDAQADGDARTDGDAVSDSVAEGG
jgi:hypothetical protein